MWPFSKKKLKQKRLNKKEFNKLGLIEKQDYLFYNLPTRGQDELLEIMREQTLRMMHTRHAMQSLIWILGK